MQAGQGCFGIPSRDKESVFLQYTSNAGQSITGNSTNIPFATKVVDSHGSWNGTTFTAPRRGWYNISGCLQATGALNVGMYLVVNGAQKIYVDAGNSNSSISCFSGGIYLNIGDALTLRGDSNFTLSSSVVTNCINISSQG